MAFDPRDIYKKLAQFLGGQKWTEVGGPAGAGEFYDVPGYGPMRVTGWEAYKPQNWDTREIWYTGEGAPRYQGGEIPDWMRNQVTALVSGSKGLSDEEMKWMARHWVYGEGMDPAYLNAFNARPSYVTDWLRAQFQPWLGVPAE